MKINRNLAALLAIISLLIVGIFAWQISSNDKDAQAQSKSSLTATPSPTVSEEPAEILEDPNPNALAARNIWTYNCEIPVQLPESIYLTCADGGWYIYKIKWASWDESEATASAYFSQNVCEPNCAEGYRVETPVTLTLLSFAKPGSKIFLTNLDMQAATDQNFENGDRTLTWDLGEFAKMMDSN